MKKLFFELMQIAVGKLDCLSRGPSPEEWQELYALAQREEVAAICYRSVVALFEFGLRAPQDISLDWMAEAEDLKERNRGVAKRLLALQQKLEEQPVRSTILLGAALARFYDKELQALRLSDATYIYVPGGLETVNLSDWTDMNIRVIDRVMLGRSSGRSGILEKWLLQNENQLFRKVGELTMPAYAMMVALQIIHVYYQYINNRLVMRDLMDLFFVLQWSEDSAKKYRVGQTTVEDVLKSLGLSRFAGGVMWMLQEVFMLNAKNFPLAVQEHEGRFLLGEMMGESHRIKRWAHLLMYYRWGDLSTIFLKK
jgi:hypothetical protein